MRIILATQKGGNARFQILKEEEGSYPQRFSPGDRLVSQIEGIINKPTITAKEPQLSEEEANSSPSGQTVILKVEAGKNLVSSKSLEAIPAQKYCVFIDNPQKPAVLVFVENCENQARILDAVAEEQEPEDGTILSYLCGFQEDEISQHLTGTKVGTEFVRAQAETKIPLTLEEFLKQSIQNKEMVSCNLPLVKDLVERFIEKLYDELKEAGFTKLLSQETEFVEMVTDIKDKKLTLTLAKVPDLSDVELQTLRRINFPTYPNFQVLLRIVCKPDVTGKLMETFKLNPVVLENVLKYNLLNPRQKKIGEELIPQGNVLGDELLSRLIKVLKNSDDIKDEKWTESELFLLTRIDFTNRENIEDILKIIDSAKDLDYPPLRSILQNDALRKHFEGNSKYTILRRLEEKARFFKVDENRTETASSRVNNQEGNEKRKKVSGLSITGKNIDTASKIKSPKNTDSPKVRKKEDLEAAIKKLIEDGIMK